LKRRPRPKLKHQPPLLPRQRPLHRRRMF
jgi:hypothetical protein